MAATTQANFASQMVAQLRALDPAISAELGTPERKIIDTVAQALAETQIDLTALNGALNLDSKYGDTLDKFLQVLGFARQAATYATGFVRFSRPTASTLDIVIPASTQVYAPPLTDPDQPSTNVVFATTFGVTLSAGQTSIVAPIQAILPGTSGNLDVGRITSFANTIPNGITQISNEQPTTGGIDQENDDEFKIRFKNTVFRNLAGTYDQYLALAVATQYTTKANVIGPISRYREYMQVPAVDDASTDIGGTNVAGNGNAGQYTTALSTLPYSKYTYATIPYFVSNGKYGVEALFYRQDTDFIMNVDNKNRGDAYREYLTGAGTDPNNSQYRPSVTLYSVYTGNDPSIQSVRPKDIILFEHSYVSTESRNDPIRNINNCVDIFIDGGNLVTANAVIPKPTTATPFVTTKTDRFYFNNFRRVGQPRRRPLVGNIFTAMYWQPTLELPSEIIVGDTSYLKDIHYFAVEDVSELRGTVRARNGIEWAIGIPGQSEDDGPDGPYTGPSIVSNPETSVTVTGYSFDKNIIDLQTSIEGAKQITTDVLAHKAKTRYFKLDISVMYTYGANGNSVNTAIKGAVDQFFASQYYGQVVQMSDILAVIHNTAGVDNVRWSNDLSPSRHRLIETDVNGNSILGTCIDRVTQGTSLVSEVQQYYITGFPNSGTYKIVYNNTSTGDIPWNATFNVVQSALTAVSIPITITGSGASSISSPFVLTFTGTGAKNLIKIISNFGGGTSTFDSDFFLKDDELPSLPVTALDTDTLPGLIIRPRAQSTWQAIPS